ncbi:hypothetical protein SAMN05421688_2851 [Poseidonocella pacifica]|uniref:Uncharacterized protein n=1 Tax=Poseidonocella pacifica TaxID=871651 RepID=A0A1I0YCM1_9RHOB|nr:hypothetical protein SAMN05421688_2851 [Poseidonocella pacifica]
MPLDRLIDLLAEAAVRKLSQQREQQDATPDAIPRTYRRSPRWTERFLKLLKHPLPATAPAP